MKGYNLPDNVSPNDPDAPWREEKSVKRYRSALPVKVARSVSSPPKERVNVGMGADAAPVLTGGSLKNGPTP